MTRGATLFSGGGGVEAMLKDSIEFVHAVEYDPAIASVYRANHGDHIQVADVCDVDYSLWGQLDYLHASPVCKNASQAKTDGEESDTDIRTALAVVRCLEVTQPRVFTLENVQGYRTFEAYRHICQALDRGGYMWHAEVLNSADFGVPQTRRRLILRAVRDSLLPGRPAPVKWVGWYAAIEDILDTLPASQFAPWQLERLPEELKDSFLIAGDNTQQEWGDPCGTQGSPARTIRAGSPPRAFIVDGQTNDNGGLLTLRQGEQPMYTLSASMEKRPARAFIVAQGCYGAALVTAPHYEPLFTVTANSNQSNIKAFLVGGGNTNKDIVDSKARALDEPSFTVTHASVRDRAYLVSGQNARTDDKGGLCIIEQSEPSYTITDTNKAPARAWLSQGRVVKMTPRALARFQSLPDTFILPERSSLACTIIGNCVPSLLMREIVRPLL